MRSPSGKKKAAMSLGSCLFQAAVHSSWRFWMAASSGFSAARRVARVMRARRMGRRNTFFIIGFRVGFGFVGPSDFFVFMARVAGPENGLIGLLFTRNQSRSATMKYRF